MASFFDHIRKSPHRNQLEAVLEHILPKLQGPVLDIGSRNRRYDHLFKTVPVAIDLKENKEKGVIFGDMTNLSFEEGSFSSVTAIEVFEYVSDPTKAVSEMMRVLKTGGTLVLSVPFMIKVHDDRYRYTKQCLRELFGAYEDITITPVGNAYTVILTILWGGIKKISFSPLRYFCNLVYIPFALLAGRSTSERYPTGYVVVVRK